MMKQIQVDAKESIISTGIQVTKGQEILIEAKGKWKDWYIETDANGWNADIYQFGWIIHWKDVPKANFMALCGKIQDKPYVFGTKEAIQVETNGELLLFANDLSFMRWNNQGHLDVTVTY